MLANWIQLIRTHKLIRSHPLSIALRTRMRTKNYTHKKNGRKNAFPHMRLCEFKMSCFIVRTLSCSNWKTSKPRRSLIISTTSWSYLLFPLFSISVCAFFSSNSGRFIFYRLYSVFASAYSMSRNRMLKTTTLAANFHCVYYAECFHLITPISNCNTILCSRYHLIIDSLLFFSLECNKIHLAYEIRFDEPENLQMPIASPALARTYDFHFHFNFHALYRIHYMHCNEIIFNFTNFIPISWLKTYFCFFFIGNYLFPPIVFHCAFTFRRSVVCAFV